MAEAIITVAVAHPATIALIPLMIQAPDALMRLPSLGEGEVSQPPLPLLLKQWGVILRTANQNHKK
jgi:hypothetical protein